MTSCEARLQVLGFKCGGVQCNRTVSSTLHLDYIVDLPQVLTFN